MIVPFYIYVVLAVLVFLATRLPATQSTPLAMLEPTRSSTWLSTHRNEHES